MSKKDYFEKEKEFLKNVYDKEGKFLSKSVIEGSINLTPEILLEKNFVLTYCDFSMFDDGIFYYDSIFKNKSDIYIYLSKKDTIEKYYKINLYFEPEKLEEIKFFIKNIIKLK
jgi:hypothetical protein